MLKYNADTIFSSYDKMQKGEIAPDTLDDDGRGFFQAIIMQFRVTNKTATYYKLFDGLIELGWSVDKYDAGTLTPITYAIINFLPDVANYLMQYHKKGDKSDYDILRTASTQRNILLLKDILKNADKIDPNTTRYRGDHILHVLAKNEQTSKNFPELKLILDTYEDIIEINPINRRGLSPLALAINFENIEAINILKNYDSKIILDKSKLLNPSIVIDTDIGHLYGTNSDEENRMHFITDYPEALEYANKTEQYGCIPQDIKDIFIM